MNLFDAVFPTPRIAEILDDQPQYLSLEIVLAWDEELPAQGYQLRIVDGVVQMTCADLAGERYARDTLRQLEAASPEGIPSLLIRDWPDFPVRGYMLDISRDRVPTRETLQGIVKFLARIRINHLQLYTEHTFAYASHAAVWSASSPMTPADVRWLDAICVEAGIELAANQNCFGHMGRWLKHEAYRALAESPDGWKMSLGIEMPASVLRPSPESLAFVTDLLDELLPNFSSRQININCDETFELGKGASADLVETQGLARTYLDFVSRIIDHLQGQGREVLFWGDVLRSHPELIAELPTDGLVALVWHYEAPQEEMKVAPWLLDVLAEFGMTEDSLRGFSAQVKNFAAASMPFWVCPGTSSWNSLVGRLSNAKANLEDAAEVGASNGASGYLITDWGDNGHFQPFCISMMPLIHGAGLSWCRATQAPQDLPTQLDRLFGEQPVPGLGRLLERLGVLCEHTGLTGMNGSPLHEKVVGGGLPSDGVVDPTAIQFVLQELEEVAAALRELSWSNPDTETVRDELLAVVRIARHGAWILGGEAGLEIPTSEALAEDLREAIEWQRAAWLSRSREGGLRDSLERLESTLDVHLGKAPPENAPIF